VAKSNVPAVGGEARAARQAQRVAVVPANWFVGQRQGGGLSDGAGDRCDALDDLTGDHVIAGLHRVQEANLDWVEPDCRRQLVHLRFVCKACLYNPKSTHRAAGEVVGAYRPTIDGCVIALVRALRVCDRVTEHGRGSR